MISKSNDIIKVISLLCYAMKAAEWKFRMQGTEALVSLVWKKDVKSEEIWWNVQF